MCVYSMIADHYIDKWTPIAPPIRPITQEEIDEFKKLLDRAREYDRKNKQPDCELEDKKKKIKELADQLGVEIDFL